MQIGCHLSSEELAPDEMLAAARRAEEAGFGFLTIGDGLCYSKMDIALADSVAEARRLAHATWPNSALGGELAQILPLPAHFEQATADVTEDQVAEAILCDQGPDAHLARLQEFADAGYDRVTVQQVGHDQARFFRFYEERVLPSFAPATAGRAGV